MRRHLLVATLAIATTAAPAAAQIRQVKLNRAYGWNASGPTRFNGTSFGSGVFIGPYGGSSPGLPNLDLFCVDFVNSVSVGAVWNARFTSLADLMAGDGVGDTRWGQRYLGAPLSYPNPVPQYQKAVWLAMQFASNGTGSWPGIHQAIWRQFTSTPIWDNSITGWQGWQSSAQTASTNVSFGNINWNSWYVVTDVNTVDGKNGKQEYLTYVTPEPETLLLLATGLVAVIGFAVTTRRFV